MKNIKLELPNVPNIGDININRLSKKRDEKILEKIIKPRDDVIQNLYKDNLNLHKELSRQTKIGVIDEFIRHKFKVYKICKMQENVVLLI